MKNFKRKILSILCVILLFSVPLTSLAHSGRTDSSGGHHDYKNKSGLGSYHYHHGMGPHLHPGGVCPYSGSSTDNSSSSQSSSYTPSPSIVLEDYPTELNVGDSSGLKYSVSNADSNDSSVVSNSPEVVKVNSDKTLTAVSSGTAKITISASGVEKSFTIEVKTVPVETIDISNNLDKIQLGEEYKFETIILPENATDKTILWTTNNDNILAIDNSGTITAKSVGTATITGTSVNDIEVKSTIEVYEIIPDKIDCENSIDLIVGDEKDLQINILPENSNNKEFTVISEDDNILKCSDSSIHAISEGNTTLHIETWNGIKKDVTIKVNIIPVEQIYINDFTKYIYSNMVDINDKILIETDVYPDNATYKEISWSSSDDNIVSVKNGEFNIKGMGKVTLTCTAHGDITNSVDLIIIDKNIVTVILIIIVGAVAVIIFIVLKRKHNKKLKS